MPKTYYIFRHGDTHATHTKTDYGDQILTAPIIPQARTYIEKMAYFLKDFPTSYNVSSELLRCRQTVEIIAEITQKDFIFDKRLNEYHMETFDEYAERITSFLSDIALQSSEHIIICTHGAGIGAIKHVLLHNEFIEENMLDFPDPGILTIIKTGKIEEIDFRNI